MDFFELEAFTVLARTLHFARSAAQIHTSPSALSRIVSRLEGEVGAKLFERDTRRVALTEEGRLFLEFAEESLRKKDTLHLMIASADGKMRGTLRVYASVTACYSILPPFVEAVRAHHPDLHLSIQTGDPADAESALREGGVDLALAALPDEGSADLRCFSVRRTPLVFVSSRQEFSVRALSEAPETLPLILPRRGLARERFDRWARERRVRPWIAAETAGNEAILALARLGLGLGLVPQLVLENSPFAEGLRVISPDPGFGDYDIGFTLNEGNPRFQREIAVMLETAYSQGSWKPYARSERNPFLGLY